MEENVTLQDLIERYLNAELPENERSAFEERLKSDADFAAQVTHYAQARQTLNNEIREQLKAQVNAAYNAYQGPERQSDSSSDAGTSGGSMRTIWRVAAAVAVIIGLSLGYVFISDSPFDAGATYMAYYETPVGPGEVRDTANDEDAKRMNPAAALYKAKDYAKASAAFKALSDDESFGSRGTAQLYFGICELELKRASSAISALSSVPESNVEYSKARWYLALAHLLNTDSDKAAKALKVVAGRKKAPHREQANEILQQMH